MADPLQSALDRVAAATTELRAATEALLALLPPSYAIGTFLADDFEAITSKAIRTTAEVYRVTDSDILGASRAQPIATARHVAMSIVADLTGAPGQVIAARFGKTDHNAVRWAVQSIRTRRQNERTTRAAYAAIMARLATGS